jgi:hypothetical protein
MLIILPSKEKNVYHPEGKVALLYIPSVGPERENLIFLTKITKVS